MDNIVRQWMDTPSATLATFNRNENARLTSVIPVLGETQV